MTSKNGLRSRGSSKAYVVTTGSVFALIFLAHVARVVAEGTHLLREPAWVALTLVAAGLAIWAWRVAGGIAAS